MRALTDLKSIAIDETLRSIELSIISGISHGKSKVSFTSENEEFTNLIKTELESAGYVVSPTFIGDPTSLYIININI